MNVTTLMCPVCGAWLDIYAETSALRCYECTSEIDVLRDGATIRLSATATRGIDLRLPSAPVASEDEVPGLEAALRDLRARERALHSRLLRRCVVRRLVAGAILVVAPCLLLWRLLAKDTASLIALVILLAAYAIMHGSNLGISSDRGWPWTLEVTPELSYLRDEIRRLESRLPPKMP
jgi:hypothetical protein